MSNETENQEPVENQAGSDTHTEQQTATEDAAAQAEANDGNGLQAKVDELKDKYVRLFADFDNYKKRVARERLELIKDASKDVILNLLPVLDDFERAVSAAETATEVAPVKEGMLLIHNKLLKNLEQKGLKPVNPVGEPFDVEFHEAITEIPAPTEDLKGKVVAVAEKGYYLNDRIIRYAKVVVGK
jgi:molecular chaperone GrpE